MTDPDGFSILKELIGYVFALCLFFGGVLFRKQAVKNQRDYQEFQQFKTEAGEERKELDLRIRSLERDSVTHADLRRIEDKIDKNFTDVHNQLIRIIEKESK